MAKDNQTLFPFGEKMFIGIVKFFDSNKGFGYIYSNNWGMESQKKFRKRNQSFYIDNSSSLNPIEEKKAVVFRPAIKDTKLRAENVRTVNLATDRELVLDYYEHSKFICFEEKVRMYSFSRHGYGHRHFNGYSHKQRKINILVTCGIARYELLNEYSEHFKKNQDYNYLLERIDKIIDVIDGEISYNEQLRGSYANKDKEHNSWNVIFSQLNNEQICNLIQRHPSLQIFAPDDLLLRNLDLVDEKWGVTETVRLELCRFKETKKLKEIENLIIQNFPSKSLKEVVKIRQLYGLKLSPSQQSAVTRHIDKLTLSQIRRQIKGMSCDYSTDFIKKANILCNDYLHLTEDGKLLFREKTGHDYEQKVIALVENFSKLEWFNSSKIEVKKFILNDKIIQEEKYFAPQKIFKEAILKDYENLFVQSDNVENLFSCHSDFEKEYACLFNQKEHEDILCYIERKCLEKGCFFSIVRLFSYLGKKLPENMKERFLCLSLNDIVSNVSIMQLFEDFGRSIIGTIVDKICETDEFFFHRKKERNLSTLDEKPENTEFVKKLVSICGKSYVEQHFVKLKLEDRIDLFVELPVGGIVLI